MVFNRNSSNINYREFILELPAGIKINEKDNVTLGYLDDFFPNLSVDKTLKSRLEKYYNEYYQNEQNKPSKKIDGLKCYLDTLGEINKFISQIKLKFDNLNDIYNQLNSNELYSRYKKDFEFLNDTSSILDYYSEYVSSKNGKKDKKIVPDFVKDRIHNIFDEIKKNETGIVKNLKYLNTLEMNSKRINPDKDIPNIFDYIFIPGNS